MSSIKQQANANQSSVSLKANIRAVRQLSDRHLNTSSRRTADKPLLAETVILRHRVSPPASPMTGSSGVSSTLRPFDSIIDVSEYWIARFRGSEYISDLIPA
jgi:hypothetical protein